MRYLVVWMCVVASIAHAADADLMISRQALAISRQELSKNVENKDALALYELANALSPKSSAVQLLGAQIKNKAVAKPTSKVKLKTTDMSTDLIMRADFIMKETFKSQVQVGYLINLYLRVAEQKKKSDKTLRKHLATLETHGITESLKDAYARNYRLSDKYVIGTRAVPQPVHSLAKADSAIAYECVRAASKLLAKDQKDELGKLWLDMGLHLRPHLLTAIIMRDQVTLSVPVKSLSGGISQEKLIAAMLDRAEYHQTKATKRKVSGHLSLLYYRMVEQLDPTNRYALLGLVRLEKLKLDQSLVKILDGPTLAAVAGLKRIKIPDLAVSDVVKVTKTPGPVKTDDGKKDTIRWDKVKAGGMVRKREFSPAKYVKVVAATLTAAIENNTGEPIEGLSAECLLIGKTKSGQTLFIAKRARSEKGNVKSGGTFQLPKTTAEFGGGNRYLSWLIIVKNSKGDVVKLHSTSSIIQNAASKIIEFPTSRHLYNGIYSNKKSFFTRSGEPATK